MKIRMLQFMMLCVLISLGCSLTASSDNDPTIVPVIQTQTPVGAAAATQTPSSVPATATRAATTNPTVVIPTSAAPPTVSAGTIERFSFATGAISGIKADVPLGANLLKEYLIRVGAGQTMTVNLSSRDANYLGLTITRASDGMVLANLPPSQTALPIWTGNIPSDGDYVIRVTNTGQATTFTLEVTAPPSP